MFRAFIASEVLGFACAYIIYRKTNTDRDFRLKLKEYNRATEAILEYYYRLGETYNPDLKCIREEDARIWAAAKSN